MSDTITVSAARWHALERLALVIQPVMLALPVDLSGGTLTAYEARALFAAWRDVTEAPHVAPQPRLFAADEAA